MIVILPFLLLVLALLFLWTVLSGGPYAPIPMRHLKRLFEQYPLTAGTHLLDLGSGDGRVLIHAAKRYGCTGSGYELNPIVIVISWCWSLISGTRSAIRWRWKSYFSADLSAADVIFIHVLPHSTGSLVKKIRAEAKPNVQVLSYGATLRGLIEIQTISLLAVGERSLFPAVAYVYRLPPKP